MGLEPGSLNERLTMSPDEVARCLGISVASVRKAIERGEIPSIRLGRLILVPILPFEEKFGAGTISPIKAGGG